MGLGGGNGVSVVCGVVIGQVEVVAILEELDGVLPPFAGIANLDAATIGVGPCEDDTVSHD